MRRLSLSAEAINYQNTTTFKELELAFRDMMYNQTRDQCLSQKRQNEQLLEAIVQNAFGANCSVEFGEEYPCVRIFDEYHNNVLIRNDWREYFAAQMNFTKRFIGASGGRRGGVDINTAKLSGLFSELPFTIYMPFDHIQTGNFGEKYRFTSEEMAAIFLHEIGHFFTYCEVFNRTVTTNQALAAMSKELDGAYSVSQRELIIGKTVDDLNLKDVDIKALATNDKKVIVETAIVSEVVEKSRSELGISVYDTNSSEFMADQFAARHGAGRHLMTGLNKFQTLFGGDRAYDSAPLYYFKQLLSIVIQFMPPFNIILIPLNIIGILLGGDSNDAGGIYDSPEARFRRIKHDTLARLKNRLISNDEKKRILADLDAMEKAMEGIKDRREWREYIATTLIPVYRKYRKTKLLQQQLEILANNPLFVRSAELATLL